MALSWSFIWIFIVLLSCLAERRKKCNPLSEKWVRGGASLIFPLTFTVKHIFHPGAVILMAKGFLHFIKNYASICLTNKLVVTPLFPALVLNFKMLTSVAFLLKSFKRAVYEDRFMAAPVLP